MHKITVAGTHRIAMAALAIDMLSSMLTDRIITDQLQDSKGNQPINHRSGQATRQSHARPASM
jgi:hypothetical protein